MKPIMWMQVHIDFGIENNDKNSKSEFGHHVRIWKCKNIFAKVYTLYWYEEDFMIKKVKSTVLRTYLIEHLNSEGIVGAFYKKELQKKNQAMFRIEKVINEKGNKFCTKWKGVVF